MTKRYLLGLDVGSSSVKASLVNADDGTCVASAFNPKIEAPIISTKPGWAEQDPLMWWTYTRLSLKEVMDFADVKGYEIKAIGISYQMHGLVCLDKALQPLRSSIIWCDSRAVNYGQKAFDALGHEYCLTHFLNSPGNFTAAKLAWIKDNEPELFDRIYKVMLPGDYIALRLTGIPCTTISGLSEGIFWDFKTNNIAQSLLDYYGIDRALLADIVPTFGLQGAVGAQVSAETGLATGTPITYRAGDQPNNALSLNVLNPGEIASTAGTSGVVYGISDKVNYDSKSRINTFAHVNHSEKNTRLGVLLCINGTGILNAWAKRNLVSNEMGYEQINNLAAQAPIGSEGVTVIPFGNGAERVLENTEIGCSFENINFNVHTKAHLLRAIQEGIVYSFCYGMDVMKEMGLEINTIHAGKANMFLSPIFKETLANVSGATINLYNTDGSIGAARGAGIGAKIYENSDEAFETLKQIETTEPDKTHQEEHKEAYMKWKEALKKHLS